MPALPVLLGLLFIVLKLTGVIAWSWLWVLAPLWIGAGLGVIALIVWAGLAAPLVKWVDR